jgi:predicted small secreted protein
MRRTVLVPVALVLAVGLAAGCSSNPSAGADGDVKPVAPPADLVGKWRLEVTDGKSTRTAVHHFKKDGHVEVDLRIETPDRKVTDLVKRAVIKVEKDRVTMVDLSHTGADGIEDVVPPERRRTRAYEVKVKGDELLLTEVDEAGKPAPQAKPTVLKRVKE